MDAEKKVIAIVKENFPNGIRDDFIDTNKVLQIYRTRYADEISLKTIAKVIRMSGLEDGSRFYFVSAEDIQSVRWLFDEILETNSIVYYSVVQIKHADFLVRRKIFSDKVLKKVLSKSGNYVYFDDFCAVDRFTRLDYEVENFFTASKVPLSFDELQKNFPYVPPEKLSDVLSPKKYLRLSDGTFFLISKIQFDVEEILFARKKFLSLVEWNGSAAPEDDDFYSNFTLNPELAEKDLLNVIYEKFFSADFTRRGKNFFKKGTVVRSRARSLTGRFRAFLSAQRELSAEKLSETAQGFGIEKYDVALDAAHESMIQVEENLFVANTAVKFDIGGVDDALKSFVRGKIISLRAITSFIGFPSVAGYSWNLFMLESFLRKFSRKFSCLTPNLHNLKIGAIYPKALKFNDYLEVQAAVLLQEKVPLEKSPVEDFLVRHGFRAKRVDKITERVIIRAQEMISERHGNVRVQV